MVGYWQVGSGSGDRDYSEECIDLGMAFVGGDKDPTKDPMEGVNEGDVIVLRRGIKQIIAVGKWSNLKGKRDSKVRVRRTTKNGSGILSGGIFLTIVT